MSIAEILKCSDVEKLARDVLRTDKLPSLEGARMTPIYDMSVIQVPVESVRLPGNCNTATDMYVALDASGNVNSVVSATATISDSGYEALVRLATPELADEVVEVPLKLDREFRFLDNTMLAQVLAANEPIEASDAPKSRRECVKCCLEDAGLKIGLAALLCLISAIIFAAATGGLGAPVVAACLGAAATVGVNLALLARCLRRCL